MVHKVDNQAEAGLEPRVKTVLFSCFWIETSFENWKVNGTGTQEVSLFIYLLIHFIIIVIIIIIIIIIFLSIVYFIYLFFLCGRLFVTPLLITSNCVVHNPFSFLFVLSK